MATKDDAREAILQKIESLAPVAGNAGQLRDLAEAWAWVTNPSQPHGGQAKISK